MADGPRRRNVESTSATTSRETTASGVTTRSKTTTTRTKRLTPREQAEADLKAAEEAPDTEALPVLWKFSTWPSYAKKWPLYAVIFWTGIWLYNKYDASLSADHGLDFSSPDRCAKTFNYSFPINKAWWHANEDSAQDWEVGVAVQAKLELQNPALTVFADDAFPENKVPSLGWLVLNPTLGWAEKKISYGTYSLSVNFTARGSAAPAALGVPAVMLAQFPLKSDFWRAAGRQVEFLHDAEKTPKYVNGALGYYALPSPAVVRAESVSFVAPFLAYYGVAAEDVELVKESVTQVELHRDALRFTSGKLKGLWRHEAHPEKKDVAASWALGNAWAAHGMARVRATVSKWGMTNSTMTAEIGRLDDFIAEILDAVIANDDPSSLFVRNFIGDRSWFGDASATALLASTALRMAVLNPSKFALPRYLDWAHAKRRAVGESFGEDGYAKPVVNPWDPFQRDPVAPGTAVAESFAVMMGAAWKDCVCKGICLPDVGTKIRGVPS